MWGEVILRLWEKKLELDPLHQLIIKYGVDETANQMNLTPEQVLYEYQMKRYRWDHKSFCADQLRISNKDGLIVPLMFNGGQDKLNAAVERQQMANKPVRIKLLKARQWGGSTYWESMIFKDSLLRPLRNTMIVAHDLDSARHLREMTQRYYEYCDLQKPPIKKETDKWWKFLHRRGGKAESSNIRIDTAEEISIGHSLTNHNLHLSEIQNWRNAQILLRGLFPTVPNNPDTMILMEGTGSGVGDFWYDQWNSGEDDGWEHVFVAWYEIEWYQLPFDSIEERNEFESELNEEESVLYKQGISLNQLNWRRSTLRMLNGDEDSFKQQYPATPEEAFLTSGRPVFKPISRVITNIAEAKKPKWVGDLVYKKDDNGNEGVIFVESNKGTWELWEKPVTDNKENLYCGGVDTSEGKAVIPELGNRGSDFQCCKIMRRDTRRFVARLHARIDPDELANELKKATVFWGGLKLLIENNPGGCGNVVIRAMKETHSGNLLKKPVLDQRFDDVADSYGWRTMKDTKRILIDELAELVRDNKLYDQSKNFWYECSTYVRDEKGATNAQPRKYDDEVISNGLTIQADKLMPMVFDIEEEKKKLFIDRDLDVPENWHRTEEGEITQEGLMERTLALF